MLCQVIVVICIVVIILLHINNQKENLANRPQEECEDEYDDCAKWAKNDECIINTEYMLYHCGKSCNSCNMTHEEIQRNIVKYNSQKPPHCVYHGADYPGAYPYLYQLYSYKI